MAFEGPTPEQIQRATEAFNRFVTELGRRQGTSKPALGFSASQEFAAAFIESNGAEHPDVKISEVFFGFADQSVNVNLRVRIAGKAWPPRPPINTQVSMKGREIAVAQEEVGTALSFVVEEPLSFSNVFADAMVGMLGKFMSALPINISDLRTKGKHIKLNFAEIIAAARPDLASSAAKIRLHRLSITPGNAHIEIGFTL